MKKVCIILSFLIFSVNINAEEIIPFQTEQFTFTENGANELPNIIIENNWFNLFMGKNPYLLLDGTLLNYKNVLSMVSIVPENEGVLNKERGWFITNAVSTIIFFGSWITWTVFYTGDDLPNAEIVRQITGYTFLGSGLLSLYAGNIRQHYTRKAISNYNLYIQGIPIPLN